MLVLADDMIAEGGLAAIAPVLALLGQDSEFAGSEWGQIILIDAMSLIIEGLANDEVHDAILALSNCTKSVAELARSILVGVMFPDRVVNVMSLDEPALLCLALLIAASGDTPGALALLDQMTRRNNMLGLVPTAGAIHAHVARSSVYGSGVLLAAN
jgi:hypothetical protein